MSLHHEFSDKIEIKNNIFHLYEYLFMSINICTRMFTGTFFIITQTVKTPKYLPRGQYLIQS